MRPILILPPCPHRLRLRPRRLCSAPRPHIPAAQCASSHSPPAAAAPRWRSPSPRHHCSPAGSLHTHTFKVRAADPREDTHAHPPAAAASWASHPSQPLQPPGHRIPPSRAAPPQLGGSLPLAPHPHGRRAAHCILAHSPVDGEVDLGDLQVVADLDLGDGAQRAQRAVKPAPPLRAHRCLQQLVADE